MKKSPVYQTFLDLISISLLAYLFLVPGLGLKAPPVELALHGGLKLFAVAMLLVLWHKKAPGEPRAQFKTSRQAIFAAIVSCLALALAYVLAGEVIGIRVVSQAPSKVDLAAIVSMLVYFGVIGPIFEEVLFRGILVDRLQSLLRSELWAYVVSTALFAALHASSGVFGLCLALVAGCLFAILRYRYKNLVSPIVAHCLFNALSIILYIL